MWIEASADGVHQPREGVVLVCRRERVAAGQGQLVGGLSLGDAMQRG